VGRWSYRPAHLVGQVEAQVMIRFIPLPGTTKANCLPAREREARPSPWNPSVYANMGARRLLDLAIEIYVTASVSSAALVRNLCDFSSQYGLKTEESCASWRGNGKWRRQVRIKRRFQNGMAQKYKATAIA